LEESLRYSNTLYLRGCNTYHFCLHDRSMYVVKSGRSSPRSGHVTHKEVVESTHSRGRPATCLANPYLHHAQECCFQYQTCVQCSRPYHSHPNGLRLENYLCKYVAVWLFWAKGWHPCPRRAACFSMYMFWCARPGTRRIPPSRAPLAALVCT